MADGHTFGGSGVHAVYPHGERGAVACVEERRHAGLQHDVAVGDVAVVYRLESPQFVHGHTVELPAGEPLGCIEAEVDDAVVVAVQVAEPGTVRRQVAAEHAAG